MSKGFKVTLVICLILGVILVLAKVLNNNTLNSNSSVSNSSISEPLNSEDLTDETIKAQFKCDRMSDDERATDIYCQFPVLYRTGDIPDEILKEKLGCLTSSPGPLCEPAKLAAYKAELIEKHLDIKYQNR